MITLRETHELHALGQRTHIGYPPQPLVSLRQKPAAVIAGACGALLFVVRRATLPA
jgi:hypothetical protein